MASPSPDAVLHLASLHALAAAGFASTSQAASMTLSSTLSRYLRLVAIACVERAALAGRTKVAAGDVVAALDDLGVRVSELYDWAEGQDGNLRGEGLSGLDEYLREGLVEKELGQMRLVPNDDVSLDEPENEDDDVKSDLDEAMDDVKPDRSQSYPIRVASPDLSWLPPLPSSRHADVPDPQLERKAEASDTPTHTPIAPQSIAERYRRPVPYASSQLAQSHTFSEPPHVASTPLPPAPTSLPSLISTYAATASDPSVYFRQNDLRRQATDLLRLSIATVDSFSPVDTLVTPIPPIRATPIVPSHSEVLPQKLLPVNPRPTGILSSLVQQIHSPHLPPALRERLTSLRPPMPQSRDGNPLFYGEPVRGPDNATLAKARGKPSHEEQSELYLRQTWDSGPRGIEKWGRGKLPSGKKVVISKEGEAAPRQPERKDEAKKVTLRLPSGTVSEGEAAGSINLQSVPSLKFKLGGIKKEPQPDAVPTPTPAHSAPDPAAITVAESGGWPIPNAERTNENGKAVNGDMDIDGERITVQA